MKKKDKLIHVDPDFHKKLKIESAELDMGIIEYTRYLAKKEEKPTRRFRLDF